MIRISICFLVFLLAGCRPEPIEGGKEIAREAQLRKVQRITPDQLFGEAFFAGDTITKLASKMQLSRVKKALEESGVAEALKFCHQSNNPTLDSLLEKYGATMQRVSQRPRNPGHQPKGQTAQLLDAYHYNAENGLPLEPNVQETDNGDFIYTKAITISDEACLKCHGEAGKDISVEDAAAIAAAYPTDKATGYKLGDLRGMWQINLNREALARNFALKQQKKKRRQK